MVTEVLENSRCDEEEEVAGQKEFLPLLLGVWWWKVGVVRRREGPRDGDGDDVAGATVNGDAHVARPDLTWPSGKSVGE
jgi:hypothetical protein